MHIKPKLKKRTLLNLAMFAFRVNPPIFREWIKPTLMKFYTSVSYFIKNLPKSICVCIIYLYNIDAYKRRVLNGGCEEERWWRGGWYGSEFDTNTLHLTPLEYGWNFRFFFIQNNAKWKRPYVFFCGIGMEVVVYVSDRISWLSEVGALGVLVFIQSDGRRVKAAGELIARTHWH